MQIPLHVSTLSPPTTHRLLLMKPALVIFFSGLMLGLCASLCRKKIVGGGRDGSL